MEEELRDESFDRILDIVGNNGYFQKRFNIIFNFCLQIVCTLCNLNIIMALAIPKHWCHVPGRENTNYTVEEWKNMTIPVENNSDGISSFSNCKMYNISEAAQINIIDCQYGWEYDQTWYLRTAVTQEDWVCGKELHVANILAFSRVGAIFGICIFGQLGDLIGRKPMFFITLSFLFVGRMAAIFTPAHVWLFALAAMVEKLATPSVFQTPLTISIETSGVKSRTFAATYQALGAACAITALPIIFWYFKDWVPFMLLTTIPSGLYFFSYRLIIESPRWLAGKLKVKECITELTKIAKINRRMVSDEVAVILENKKNENRKTYGFISLFSNWSLAKKTILTANMWIAMNIIDFALFMNINNLDGNPFLNYFFQGLMEFPAGILGKYTCDKIGRIWCHRIGFISTTICSILLFFIINNNELVILSLVTAVILKLFSAYILYAVGLHATEIFPTCVRQTGTGFCVLAANAFGVLGPYIIYLGTSTNLKYPYGILAGFSILGLVCGSFLPETQTSGFLKPWKTQKISQRKLKYLLSCKRKLQLKKSV